MARKLTSALALFSSDPHEMTVMWATRTSNVLSIVECWPFDRPKRKKQFRGSIATLEGSPTVIHTVRIKGALLPRVKNSLPPF